MTVADRAEEVRARIRRAAARAGRDPNDVTLVAVSKTFPPSAVDEAAAAGLTVFGENRAQELADKIDRVTASVEWHFVGHLQTNKVKHVVGNASLIHSLDSMRTAEAIARRATSLGVEQQVLMEVNIGGEKEKSGVVESAAVELASSAQALDGIEVLGVMTIPPLPDSPEDSRGFYKRLSAIRDEVRSSVPSARHLSMGMTRDFEVAIEEGATIVRVGEAIFGPRNARAT